MDKVSIIVPVYNCEKYLDRCLKSLVNQTYKNIEIIVIDDESSDNSPNIEKEYEEKYDFIKIIRRKKSSDFTMGPGNARNAGLDAMSGTYFTFVDSDDYVSLSYISDMYDKAVKYKTDLVQCGNVYMLETRNIFKGCDGKEFYSEEYSEYKTGLRQTVWGRLYKTERYKDIRFNNKRIGEDSDYSDEIIKNTESMVFTGKCMYGYRSYMTSITREACDNKILSSLSEKDFSSFTGTVKKLLDGIEHRSEQILYKKQLQKIKELCCEKSEEFISDKKVFDELINRINSNIALSDSSSIKYIKVCIRHRISTIMAFIRTAVNYEYKLDER